MALVRLVFFSQGNPQRGQTVETHLLVVVPEAGEISHLFLNGDLGSTTQPPPQRETYEEEGCGGGRGGGTLIPSDCPFSTPSLVRSNGVVPCY